MKKLTKFFILLAILLNFTNVYAQENNDDLKTTLSKDNLSEEEAFQAYKKLDSMVQTKKANLSMKELLEMCVLYSKHDSSDAAYDLASDLKSSDPKEFKKALKELSKEDREKIEEFIRLTDGEAKNGNG